MPHTHDPNSPFPILRNAAWKFLLRDLEKGRFGPLIKAASERINPDATLTFAHLALSPVAALAYMIAKSFPDLAARKSLRVMVFPHGDMGAGDGGRWYQLLAPMLGDLITIEVTIAQPDPDDPDDTVKEYRAPARLKQALSGIDPCASSFGGMDAYIAEGHAPDIVYFPLLPMTGQIDDMVTPDRLPELLARGCVLMGVNGDTWAERDTAIALLEAYRIGAAESVDQPFGLAAAVDIPEDYSVAQYGWVLRPSTPEDMDIQWGRIQEVHGFIHSFLAAEDDEIGNPFAGQWLKLGNDPHGVLAGLGAKGVNLKTRQVYDVQYTAAGGYSLEAIGEAPNSNPMFEPEEGLSRMDLALHASHAMGTALFPDEVMEGMDEFFAPDGSFGAGMIEEFMAEMNYTREQATEALGRFSKAMTGKDGVEAGLPLFVAASEDDPHAVHAAIAQGHDPNARDDQGWPPLCAAVDAGATRAVTALLEAGADVHRTTDLGWRPIDYALTRGHAAAAIVLLEAGATIDGHQVTAGFNPSMDVVNSGQAPASVIAWLASHRRRQ